MKTVIMVKWDKKYKEYFVTIKSQQHLANLINKIATKGGKAIGVWNV